MTDIDASTATVERVAAKLSLVVPTEYPARLLRQLAKERDEARNAALEEAATLIEDGFDRPSAEPFRKDGVYSKNDKCPHGRWHYEDCEQCASAAIRALITPKPDEPTTT